MAGITRFEEIEAWKSARQLTIVIYKLSEIKHPVRSPSLSITLKRIHAAIDLARMQLITTLTFDVRRTTEV